MGELNFRGGAPSNTGRINMKSDTINLVGEGLRMRKSVAVRLLGASHHMGEI